MNEDGKKVTHSQTQSSNYCRQTKDVLSAAPGLFRQFAAPGKRVYQSDQPFRQSTYIPGRNQHSCIRDDIGY